MTETTETLGSPVRRNTAAKWILTLLALAALVGLVTAWAVANRTDNTRYDASSFVDVGKGPLTISVTESGTIKSREQVIIKNEVEGQSVILYLIEEGTKVKAGDLLFELDASRLQDQRVEQQIKTQNAEAAFIRARENLEVVKNQAKSDISKAELEAQFAVEDLRNYDEGNYPKELHEAQAKISVSQEELQRAEDRLKWSKMLFTEKYLSGTELMADELSTNKARLEVTLAEGDLELLTNFTYGRKKAELASNVEQTTLALERVQRKASADTVQAEAELKAKDLEFSRQKDLMAKVLQQIEKTKVIAPRDGLVVYATTGQGGGWRGNTEPLAEGQTVRERQDMIYLPTAASVMAEIKVRESSLDKVQPGLPVVVTVDALPGKQFAGKVNRIAPLPDAQSAFMNPDLKVYNTEIFLDGDGSEMRTGMTCRAEIIVDYFPEATFVPVQTVVRVGETPTVWVKTAKGSEPRAVELGMDNNRMAHIKSGLDVGEKVLITPPLAAGSIAKAVVSEDTQKVLDQVGKNPKPAATPAAAPAAGGSPADASPANASPAGGGPPQAGGMPAGGWGNMTDEQRAEMRKRMEAMTPEEREQMRQRWQGGGGAAPAGGAAMDAGGGQAGDPAAGGQGRRRGGDANGGGPAGAGAPGQGGGGNWGANMTDEQRAEMRKRFEAMTPEEREQMRQRWQGGGGGAPGAGGGAPVGGAPGGGMGGGGMGGGPR